ncbi:MAG: hypothetical protein D6701_09945 [Gemmatimonadetes bacterium]|nr:MAG: hypothetical protein D6701_09945 [Gemmatimonadota bacterium]
MHRSHVLAGLIALTISASPVAAQRGDGGARGYLELAFVAADPRGEFATYVDEGFGVQLTGRWQPDPSSWVSLRTDLGFINYGNERFTFCSQFSCRLAFDLTTRNNIFYLGLGPEIEVPSPVLRPYAFAAVGLGYFATTSSLRGSSDFDDFANTVNFDDAVLQWRAGGGVRVRLSGGDHPVALDIGGEYHGNGEVEYLTEGDIVDNPDGSVTLFPIRSEANLATFRIGVSIGFGDRSGERRGRRRHRH